jgi:CDP-glucose 4,6-dehydratase
LPPQTNPNLFALCNLEAAMNSQFLDIRDSAALETALLAIQPQVIFHLAAQALVRESIRDPLGTYATNVLGTANLLESARRLPSLEAVVVVTSDKCYENDGSGRAFREADCLGGADPYSSSKAAAEMVTSAYRATFFKDGPGVATARAGNVIGGGDWASERLVPDIVAALEANHAVTLRNPQSTRPWQHVAEPLCGYLSLARRLALEPAQFASAWNFGPSEPPLAVAAMTEKAYACWPGAATPAWIQDSRAQPAEADTLRIDPTRAAEALGWQTKLSQQDAMEWTIEWYARFSRGDDASMLTIEQLRRYEELQ